MHMTRALWEQRLSIKEKSQEKIPCGVMLLSILCKSANCTGPDEEVTSPANSVAGFWPTKFPALKREKRKDHNNKNNCRNNFKLI